MAAHAQRAGGMSDSLASHYDNLEKQLQLLELQTTEIAKQDQKASGFRSAVVAKVPLSYGPLVIITGSSLWGE